MDILFVDTQQSHLLFESIAKYLKSHYSGWGGQVISINPHTLDHIPTEFSEHQYDLLVIDASPDFVRFKGFDAVRHHDPDTPMIAVIGFLGQGESNWKQLNAVRVDMGAITRDAVKTLKKATNEFTQ